MNTNRKTATVVGLGLLTALVIVLQAFASSIRFGVFNITLVLVPIIVGAAIYGWYAGAWLGFVFGVVVLLTDAGVFLAVNVPGTIFTCIVKGAMAGVVSGLIYRATSKKNRLLAAVLAGIAAPVTNTGIFLICCRLFFYDTIAGWAAGLGFSNVGLYMILGLAGTNFLTELVINLVLAPAVVTIINTALRGKTEESGKKSVSHA
ncbi:MAG: ECF transporter S component [Lachnospiraceae bacterium]|nr:ECF transporter S component [Lachnospiraceae bacterium]